MSIIVPAILRKTYEEIKEDVNSIKEVTSYVQIDITDGIFVDNISWPFNTDEGIKNINKLGDLGIDFELDVMVNKPEEILDILLSTSAKRIIIHLKSTNKLEDCIARIQESGKEVGIALSIDDQVSDIEQYIDAVHMIQCMAISHIGVQGEPYDNRVEKNIISVHELDNKIKISVDGAQSINTIPGLSELGVTQFCVGSAIFSGDSEERYKELTNILK